ncbi:MAG: heavy metal-responsive transcriptional regulator [Gemmatimonadota bacterium]|nr:heavy metal-responsive transcriptional regulator [Gemmatimonadota bacterium]
MVLTIGKLASAAGVNTQTIRYYERAGLFPVAARSPGGYRQFGPDELRRLRFIRRAQGLGFSLAEIRELLALRVHDPRSCGTVARRVHQKIVATEQKIRELQGLLKALTRLGAACDARERTADCPILEALADGA